MFYFGPFLGAFWGLCFYFSKVPKQILILFFYIVVYEHFGTCFGTCLVTFYGTFTFLGFSICLLDFLRFFDNLLFLGLLI